MSTPSSDIRIYQNQFYQRLLDAHRCVISGFIITDARDSFDRVSARVIRNTMLGLDIDDHGQHGSKFAGTGELGGDIDVSATCIHFGFFCLLK